PSSHSQSAARRSLAVYCFAVVTNRQHMKAQQLRSQCSSINSPVEQRYFSAPHLLLAKRLEFRHNTCRFDSLPRPAWTIVQLELEFVFREECSVYIPAQSSHRIQAIIALVVFQ